MRKIMIRTIFAVFAVSTVILACSMDIFNFSSPNSTSIKMKFDKNGYWKTPNFWVKRSDNGESYALYGASSKYGAYLAGRLAYMRQDLDAASEYYKIVLDKEPENESINRHLYVILTSLGDIKEAASYAKNDIDNVSNNDNGIDNQTLALLIVAINDFSNKDYDKALQNIKLLDNREIFKSIINPLFKAWIYAGKNDEAQAIAQIDSISNEDGLSILKLHHKAIIYDYLGNNKKASEIYSSIIIQRPTEVTYRMLEIITDFYVRNGEKDIAKKIFKRYTGDESLAFLFKDINNKINNKSPQSPAIINSPQKGLAEAMFDIGTIFRVSSGGIGYAQLFIASSAYLNPEYDVSKIALANILDEVGLYNEANKYYASISDSSASYFIAKLKMIENLNTLEKYDEAEDLLRKLLKDYPNNVQLLNNLGDILRSRDKNSEAIKIYKKAIESFEHPNNSNWPIYYSIAVSYDLDNQKDKAEENLKMALKLSNRNPNVLNYLGYTWLSENKNTDEAIQMIVDAYKKMPYDGHVIDSLGWVYFKLGDYQKSIDYLEQASDMNPANAVISEHLGDAYWMVGRKNEAIFQWKHALVLKEDAIIVNKSKIQNKIDEGLADTPLLKIKSSKLQETLNKLSIAEEKNKNAIIDNSSAGKK